MGIDNTHSRSVKATGTAFTIIESLQRLGGGGVTEVSEDLGLAKSTVHKHLATLEDEEYVTKHNGTYELGLKFLDHGWWAKNNLAIAKAVKPALKEIAQETGEVAWLLVEEHGRAVYLCKEMGEHAVQTNGRIGKREYIHALSGGKAMLAYLPKERVNEIINQHGLPKRSKNTIIDQEDLFEELEKIRERNGIAYNDEEVIDGLRAVSSVIRCNGEVQGSIGVAGPVNRMTGKRYREKLTNTVSGAASEVELRLSYS